MYTKTSPSWKGPVFVFLLKDENASNRDELHYRFNQRELMSPSSKHSTRKPWVDVHISLDTYPSVYLANAVN